MGWNFDVKLYFEKHKRCGGAVGTTNESSKKQRNNFEGKCKFKQVEIMRVQTLAQKKH